MRHSIKRISKSALSVILALMMVVSTMVVGTISSVNAATFVPNSKIYLDVSKKTYWTEAGYIYMYLYDGGTTEFVKMNKVDGESYIYEGTVNNANNNKIIFLRNRDDIKDFKQWNQTVDIDNYDGTNNMFVLSSDDSTQKFKDVDGKENVAKQTGNWSTYGGSTGGGGETTTNYYVVGSENLIGTGKGWNPDKASQMTNTDGVYSITFSKKAASTKYEFKILPTLGSWVGQIGHSSNVSSGSSGVKVDGNNNGGNIEFTLSEQSDVTITYTPSDEKIIISATPVVSDYTVSVEARYKAYNNSNQSYDAATETPSDLNATFTVNGGSTATVSPNTPVTLSASTTNNDKYTFAGWYIDEACTSQVELNDYKVTPTANTTYYALYRQNTKTITYNVEPSGLNGAGFINDSVKTAGVGSEVSVSAKTVAGYTSNITATGATISGGKFTVGTSDVTVTATYDVVEKELCSVSVNANNSSLGTATVQSGDIYVGDEFTVTATANTNCAFSSWTAVGADHVSTSTSGNETSAKFRATAQSVTITANFNTYSYSVHTSSEDIVMTPFASDSNVLYSAKTVASGTIFRIKRTLGTEEKYSVSNKPDDTYYLNDTEMTHQITSWDGTDELAEKKGNYKNNAGSAYYVMFDVSTGTVSLSETNDGTQSIKVYAKNGTCTYDKNGNFVGTHLNGVTVATAANESSTVTDTNANSEGYKVYKVTEGSVVKVTTTVNASYAKDYYVHAFVINGKTYSATAGTGNSYYTEFAVEEGVANYEVTPIYYVNDCKTEGKYITFYVDASEMGEAFDWGNTISSYAYAYKADTGTDSWEPDGNYPGQPMLYDEGQGRYYARVPKTMNGRDVSGITINNYKNDTVHASLNKGLTANEQSYDFNDFKKIYDLKYDIIRFDMKPRSGAQNNSELIGSAFNYNTYANNNRWEAFVDNNGNKVDVLGNPITSSNTNKLYVVSSYQANVSGVGQWSTKWTVYKQDGTKVAEGLPSDFIPRPDKANNTKAYNDIVNGGYTGWEAEITFENRQDLDSALRLDGRWFYAKSSSSVSADVKYRTSEDGNTYTTPVEDASYVTINDAPSVTLEKHGETIRVVARPIKGYVFSHWSTADAKYTTFKDLSKTLGSSFTSTLDAETHYVANYIKATDGKLVLSHMKYDGSDAKGGMGYYLIKAEIIDANGQSKGVVKGTGNGANGQSIELTDLSSSDSYIRVTITTVTSGENTFRYWYTQSSNGFEIIDDLDGIRTANGKVLTDSEDPFGVQGTVTYTFETEVWKLFSGTAQIMSELNFYSDIAPVSKDYTLTYKYKDRFGNDKIYVVKGTHPDSYYTDNKSWAPSDKLITDNAPPIDDLYKNCKWVIANSNKDGTDATLVAIQNQKTYKVDIYNALGASESFDLPINSYVINKDTDNFFVADEYIMDGDTRKKFSYWAVYKRNSDGSDGHEVARHFYREYTLVVLDDYNIRPIYGTEVKDQVYISAPQYTREKYSNDEGKDVKDTLYADFMVAYMSSNGALIRDDSTGEKYKTGVLVEFGPNYKLTTDKNGVAENPDYSSIIYSDSSKATLEEVAKTVENGKYTMYNAGDDTNKDYRAIYNFTANNSDYNNMNRLDYYVAFKNSPANRSYVMKAYYYVIVDGQFMVSDSVYFNLYDIGTSDPDTVK
ncbi:MAG TPA: hypothetical protein DE313_04555 [Ruminococcus sp.]|nr:hypothetical protein [Ruminococcus sp.]